MRSCFAFVATLLLTSPALAADSVFVDGAFTGTWGASFAPLIPQIIGPIEFNAMTDAEGVAKMNTLKAGSVADLCPASGEKREFYGGEYDYQKFGEFAGCTNGTSFFGVYKDYDGSDSGSIAIDMTFPDDSPPHWSGSYTNAVPQTGPMQGLYQGGGIATPLARVGAQPTLANISGASFGNGNGLAPESWVSAFGANLANGTFVDASLPTALGGAMIVITDSTGQMFNAGLLLVSPGQINYVIPAGVAPGQATIVSMLDGVETGRETVTIAAVAPAIFSAASSGSGVAAATYLRVNPDGTRDEGLIYDGSLMAIPLDLGPEGAELYLSLYGTGMRNFMTAVTVTIDGMPAPFFGPVAQGQFDALDQINLGPIPRELAGRGEVDIVITVDGKQANVVTVAFQ